MCCSSVDTLHILQVYLYEHFHICWNTNVKASVNWKIFVIGLPTTNVKIAGKCWKVLTFVISTTALWYSAHFQCCVSGNHGGTAHVYRWPHRYCVNLLLYILHLERMWKIEIDPKTFNQETFIEVLGSKSSNDKQKYSFRVQFAVEFGRRLDPYGMVLIIWLTCYWQALPAATREGWLSGCPHWTGIYPYYSLQTWSRNWGFCWPSEWVKAARSYTWHKGESTMSNDHTRGLLWDRISNAVSYLSHWSWIGIAICRTWGGWGGRLSWRWMA